MFHVFKLFLRSNVRMKMRMMGAMASSNGGGGSVSNGGGGNEVFRSNSFKFERGPEPRASLSSKRGAANHQSKVGQC